MEVEKMESNGEYEIDNIILACIGVIMQKAMYTVLLEFKEVARGINFVWNDRLHNDIVEFREDAYERKALKSGSK